ncbi:MAG: amidohydrolase family protein, partial [Acidobacteriota bacterium]
VSAEEGAVYAIKDCRIVPVVGEEIPSGVIVIRDGLIHAIGADVAIPSDAVVIEGEGLIAYPGLIDTHTKLLVKLPKEPERPTQQAAASPQPSLDKWGLSPDLLTIKVLEPNENAMERLRNLGITTVLTVPDTGIMVGQSAVVNLAGNAIADMVLKSPAALHIEFNTARGMRSYPSSLMGSVALIRQTFYDAQNYKLRWERYRQNPRGMRRPPTDPALEALIPVVEGKLPVVFTTKNQNDIRRAYLIAQEFNLKYMVSGANEGWKQIELLKSKTVPLLITMNFKAPNTAFEAQQGKEVKERAEKEIYPLNALKLQEAGLKFAINSYGLTNPNDLTKNLQTAIEKGLPAGEALRAMTINAAEFLCIDQQVGSLEKGKIANIVLSEGELFAKESKVKYVFVDGKKFEVKAPKKKPAAEGEPANIAGEWTMTIESPMMGMELTMTIEQSGDTFTGNLKGEMGEWELHSGSIEGNQITFTISVNIMEEIVELEVEGTVEEDTMSGTIEAGEAGTMDWKAVKVPTLVIHK